MPHEFALPITAVALGTDDKKSYNFLALTFERKLDESEHKEIRDRMVMHLQNHGISFVQTHAGHEMHFRPSKRSRENFATIVGAIEEYKLFLVTLNAGDWQDDLVRDASLHPFAERSSPQELRAAGLRYG